MIRTWPEIKRRTAVDILHWRADLLALATLALLSLACLLLAYQVDATTRIDLGTSYAQPYTSKFFPAEENESFDYAFTSGSSEVRLPGLGQGTHHLKLRVSGWRPGADAPVQLTLADGGRALGSFALRDQREVAPVTYHVLAPSRNGDLALRLNTSTFVPGNGDTRELGVAVDWVEAAPLQIVAAPGQLAHVTVVALLLYLLLRRLAVRPLAAAGLTAAAVVGLAGLLAVERIWWTIYTPRLWALLLGLHLALGPLAALARWMWRRGDVSFSPQNTIWLLRIVVLAALVKIGGVIYPHIIVYDQRWHVPRTQMVLDGRFVELLVPSRVTLLDVTVGLEGGHFPYSPLWYLLTAPFGVFGLDLGIASNVLNTAIDVSRSLLICYIALRLFGNQRAALFAAGTYHLLEMPYYLISWGNWPTQLGLWAGLVAIAVVAATFERPRERATLIALTAAALLAMLSYTVLGIITFTMIGMLAVLEWLRRAQPGPMRGRTILTALVLAELAAFGLYHVWYAPTIFAETLPAIARAMASEQRELHGAPKPDFLGDLTVNWNYTLNHLSWAVLGALPIGAVLAWRQAQRGRLVLVAWALTLVVFAVFSWAVADMIFKHIFFLLPLVAICLGLLQAAFWQRGGLFRLVPAALWLYLAAFCAERWYFYIMIKRH